MKIIEIREARDRHLEAQEYQDALNYSELLLSEHKFEIDFDDWFKKGLCHFNLDQDEQAVESYTNALTIEPYNFQAMTNKAISLLRLDNEKEAFVLLKKALGINPHIAPAWFNIGFYHIANYGEKAGAYEKAVNAFRRAVRDYPEFADAKIYLPFHESYGTIGYLLRFAHSVQECKDDQILKLEDD